MTESWRPIAGYEGSYDVSDQGRVRSLRRRSPHLLRLSKDRGGYLFCTLSVDKNRKQLRVHRAVAQAFLGPVTGPVVRHIDGDPSNNAASNLAYGTDSENQLDSVAHGTHGQSSKRSCSRGHPYSTENTYVDSTNHRHCRKCNVIRAVAYKSRQKGSR